MTIEELRDKLSALKKIAGRDYDHEVAHLESDRLLLDYINDEEVTRIFDADGWWYA